MGYIKEPTGVDFIINGKPLTNKQKQAISDFIKTDKDRLAKLATHKTKVKTNRQKLNTKAQSVNVNKQRLPV
jgi:hypothetical protein